MKNTKVILLSALLSSSVTISTASAEGFFSNIFGATKSTNSGFSTLLSHVPADTSYLLSNKNPFPEEVMAFHLTRSKDIMKMISDLDKKDQDKAKKGEAGALLSALLEELSDKLSNDKLEDTGLSLKATSMIYGYDLMPVIRMTFSDKEKLMATLKRAEKKSGYKAELTKCGEYDCFVDTKNKEGVALVFLKDHLAASLFPADEKQKIIDHLTGKSLPKQAYSTEKWDSFLKENNYTGFGEGYIDLKKLSVKLKPKIVENFGKMDPKELDNCMAVAEDHINNMPEIIFGTKNLDVKKMDYEMVIKTSPDVSATLQTIANTSNIAKRIENPIFDLGVNINFTKLRDALTQYSNFLIKSGEAHKCKSIDPKEIRKGMGGMMMAMNMGLTQFKSIYASVADIELSDKMEPKKIDAYISIGTDDPAGLLAMVGMLSPKLMGFQVPSDGSTVKLPAGTIPSKGQATPDVYLSRTAKSLNIMVGNDKPALKDYKSDTAEIMSISLDGKRYYGQLANIMKMMPKDSSKDAADASKMMESMGDMMGNIEEIFSADKRGLVINYSVKY